MLNDEEGTMRDLIQVSENNIIAIPAERRALARMYVELTLAFHATLSSPSSASVWFISAELPFSPKLPNARVKARTRPQTTSHCGGGFTFEERRGRDNPQNLAELKGVRKPHSAPPAQGYRTPGKAAPAHQTATQSAPAALRKLVPTPERIFSTQSTRNGLAQSLNEQTASAGTAVSPPGFHRCCAPTGNSP
jgi:hypothetical protein